MKQATKQPLDTAQCIEFSPVVWRPTTGDERLAALVGYVTGDGNIHRGQVNRVNKLGEVKTYDRIQCAFYSNERQDLDQILEDCMALGLTSAASVTRKKNTHPARVDGWQIQLSKMASEALIEAGAPVGKKTEQHFEVPEWILKSELTVQRAYVGALFGAEGTTPSFKGTGGKIGRSPVLHMRKRPGYDGAVFFDQLKSLLDSLGVRVVASQSTSASGYVTNTLRISAESILAFYENVSYVYAGKKAELAWLCSKYIRTCQTAAQKRTQVVEQAIEDGENCYRLGKELEISCGGAYNLMQRVKTGKMLTTGQGFPTFDEWLAPRWDADLRLLKLGVVARQLRPERHEVWNMLVSSPDHSYLLASGANNYNSFESMSGRVYYAFDRKVHVKPLEFNPVLPIWIGQDFNIDPMSSVVFQMQRNGELWAVDEICLANSNTQELCDELERRYWRYLEQIIIYPDPAGAYRGHQRGESDLDIFRERGFKKQKFRRKHPPVSDRINAVNRMLTSADGKVRMYVDPRCKKLIEALEQTLYLPGGREVDKTRGIEHAVDAAGYCIEFEFPLRKFEILGLSI